MKVARRNPTRIYPISKTRSVQILKDFSQGHQLYRVANYPDDGPILLLTPSFTLARHFVRKLRQAER